MNNLKRRRVNEKRPYKLGNKRVKYQKRDIVWTPYNDRNEPVIILNCQYEENERFYPSKYEILWLNWTDTTDENNRTGLCSITIQSYNDIKSCITNKEFDELFQKESISINGLKEMKKYRPDIYTKYFDLKDNKRKIIKTKKMRRKRRASIMKR